MTLAEIVTLKFFLMYLFKLFVFLVILNSCSGSTGNSANISKNEKNINDTTDAKQNVIGLWVYKEKLTLSIFVNHYLKFKNDGEYLYVRSIVDDSGQEQSDPFSGNNVSNGKWEIYPEKQIETGQFILMVGLPVGEVFLLRDDGMSFINPKMEDRHLVKDDLGIQNFVNCEFNKIGK